MSAFVEIALRCPEDCRARARYVFDTLFASCRVPVRYLERFTDSPDSVFLLYGDEGPLRSSGRNWVGVPCSHGAWDTLGGAEDVQGSRRVAGLPVVFPAHEGVGGSSRVPFDLVANAFYFLTCWAEQRLAGTGTRQFYKDSVYARLGVPLNVVDRYLHHLLATIDATLSAQGRAPLPRPRWPRGAPFAVVLSHDVDFIPSGPKDVLEKAMKTLMRSVLRHRSPGEAARVLKALAVSAGRGNNPYRCIPDMLRREAELGVSASYQVAVARHHPDDVSYRIEDEETERYLRTIIDAGFEVCLHGSYRSTERRDWYRAEADALTRTFGKPIGARQHFLSFDFCELFSAQEEAGIEFDMSIGYPDRAGFRSGFSHPFFPYNLREDRPFRVLEIPTFLMDVTLRSYMGLRVDAARARISHELARLNDCGGCGSVVWHPILFGGARDAGYDTLYWNMVGQILAMKGLATDGRTINSYFRPIARQYASFSSL